MKKFLIAFSVLLVLGTVFVNADNRLDSKIYFKFGDSNIVNQFKDNGQSLLNIDSVFSKLNVSKLLCIKIIGSSSPEGDCAFNSQLSYNRAEVFQKYIGAKYNIPDSLFRLQNLGVNTAQVDDKSQLRYAELIVIDKKEIAENIHAEFSHVNVLNNQKAVVLNEPLPIKNMLLGVLLFLLIIGITFGCVKNPHIVAGIFNFILTLIKQDSLKDKGKEIPQAHKSNSEGYTNEQLLNKPILDKFIGNTQYSKFEKAKVNCNKRRGKKIYEKNGQPCFDNLRVGCRIKLPSGKAVLNKIKEDNIYYYNEIMEGKISPDELSYYIRTKYTYPLVHKHLSKEYKIPFKEVKNEIIGGSDLVIHEDKGGYAILVPNTFHYNHPHEGAVKGYVDYMLKNKK